MQWFRNLPVKGKLLLSFSVVAAIAVVVGIVGVRNIRTIDAADTRLYVENTVPLSELGRAGKYFQRARGNVRDVILARNDAEVADYAGRVNKLSAELDSIMKQVEPMMTTPERKQRFAAVVEARTDWSPIRNAVLREAQAGRKADALETLTDGYATIKKVEVAIDSLDALLVFEARAIADTNTLTANAAVRGMTIAIALGVVVAMLLGWFIAQMLARPLGRAVGVLETVAGGDLTTQLDVDTNDEVGRMGVALNEAVSSMASAVSSISENAQTLAGSSEELNAVSGQMGANAEETATQANIVSAAAEQVSRNIQTVATGAEEMSASIREIAKNTAEASRVAANAVEVAESTNKTISKLGDSSIEIGNVIKVITSIAEQTNLLALNATIEAARAGEAGKGFAVVANEVKELAKETAKATEEIGRKVAAIQGDTEGAVSAIREIGTIITQINDIQTTIASAVEEQTATTAEIGRNVTEAAKGSAEIAQNIAGVAQAAQSTSSGATQSQAAASELSRMASELQRIVGRFTVTQGESVTHNARAAVPAQKPGTPRSKSQSIKQTGARRKRALETV
jgi:methyl-accepting chemotaxis protein